MLSQEEVADICRILSNDNIGVCILQEFDTEFEFSRKVRLECYYGTTLDDFYRESFQTNVSLLIIQCDSGHLNSDLLACAKYRVDDIFTEMSAGADRQASSCHILFTVLIPRENSNSSFVGFLGGDWICYHIDDFCPDYDFSPVSLALSNTPLSLLFYNPDEASMTSLHCGTFNHCRFLYKNITEAISILFHDLNFEGRSHDLNNILYRLLMVNCNDEDSSENTLAFYEKAVQCIFQHLKQNETNFKNWIIDVASQPTELQKGGAFVKVLLRRLDRIVNEILAQIIAFLDRNHNLELIDPKASVPLCVRKFWIAAFPKLVNYYLSSSAHKFRNDIHEYRCKFPFSREIQCGIDGILIFQGHSVGRCNGLNSLIFCLDSSDSVPNHLMLTYDLVNEVATCDFDEMKARYIHDVIQTKWSRTYRNEATNECLLEVCICDS